MTGANSGAQWILLVHEICASKDFKKDFIVLSANAANLVTGSFTQFVERSERKTFDIGCAKYKEEDCNKSHDSHRLFIITKLSAFFSRIKMPICPILVLLRRAPFINRRRCRERIGLMTIRRRRCVVWHRKN